MKRYGLTLFILTVAVGVNAQVSVYDCGVYDKNMTQTEVNNSPQSIHAACITLGENGNMNIGSTTQRTFIASDEITLKDDVTLGVFSPGGEVHLKNGEKSGNLDVAVMNYASLHGVLRYKKLEFGIEVPANILSRINHYLHNEGAYTDELNPFLEWDVDLEATFTHLATGQTKKIDGFYTRDYVVNTQTDDWDDVGTNYPFRIRFAPPLNGEWSVKISLRIKNETIPSETADDFWFTTVESGDPGYVKVFDNKRNLKRGDKMIFPVGHNFPSPYTSAIWDTDDHLEPSKTTRPSKWQDFLDMVQSYFNQGGKYIRNLQTPSSSLIEFEKLGNYYDRLHYAWETDRYLELCESYDALMLFNMMIHEPIMKYADYNMEKYDFDHYYMDSSYNNSDLYPAYCYNINPGTMEPYQMFQNGFLDPASGKELMAFHEQRTRYYISRYGYSTSIFEFELLSEPYHLGESWSHTKIIRHPVYRDDHPLRDLCRDAIQNYHTRLAGYIKNHLYHNEHLIGCIVSTLKWAPDNALPYMDSGSVQNPNIDIVNTNLYSSSYDNQIVAKEGKNYGISEDENSTYAKLSYLFTLANKPVFLSENGHEDKNLCSNFIGHYVDVMTQGFNGCAGFLMWDGFMKPPASSIDQPSITWASTIRAQNHFNANDFISTLSNGYGFWAQGRQAEKHSSAKGKYDVAAVETQYFISANQEKAVGYVRNRTYNVHTKRTNSDCDMDWGDIEPIDDLIDIEWDDLEASRRLKIQKLKSNTDYNVDWYSFKTGVYLKSDCLNTQGQNLILHYPKLSVEGYQIDNPVVWFVVYQKNCQQSRAESGEESMQDQEQENFVDLSTNKLLTQDVSIYPNPFNSELNVNNLKQNDTVIVYDIMGKKVKEYAVFEGDNKLATSSLGEGVYIVHLLQSRTHYRLIKK